MKRTVQELLHTFRATPLTPLSCLLVGDMLLVGLHLVFCDESRRLNIQKDQSYAEFFQYFKEGSIALMLGFIALHQGRRLHAVFAALFCYLLIDDAFSMHEWIGARLITRLGLQPMFRLRSQDYGELIASAVVGLVSLTAIALAYRWGSRRFRQESGFLVACIVVLAFFGVGVDMLHVMVPGKALQTILGVVEDGGEMVVMTFILWSVFAFALNRRAQHSPVPSTASPGSLRRLAAGVSGGQAPA